jgi:hypothetical protein
MSNWTNTIKNASSFINQTKNSAIFTNQSLSHTLAYILTDALDFVLLGQNSDEVLIWDTPTEWSNLAKN